MVFLHCVITCFQSALKVEEGHVFAKENVQNWRQMFVMAKYRFWRSFHSNIYQTCFQTVRNYPVLKQRREHIVLNLGSRRKRYQRYLLKQFPQKIWFYMVSTFYFNFSAAKTWSSVFSHSEGEPGIAMFYFSVVLYCFTVFYYKNDKYVSCTLSST